jgi:hypothetical protein
MDTLSLHSDRRKLTIKEKDDEIDILNRVFIAGKKKLYLLVMKQFHVQVSELQSNKQFDEAISVCEMLKNTPKEIDSFIEEG